MAEAEAEAMDAGWWQRAIVSPLEALLRDWFGKGEVAPSATAGNVAVLGLRLSGPLPAGETAVVNLRQSGDKSIHLVEGARLEFTAENWDTPAQVVVQLDPKLNAPTTASLEALSGISRSRGRSRSSSSRARSSC